MRSVHAGAQIPYQAPMPTAKDLELLGAAVYNSVSATVNAGHSSPGETLDYLHGLDVALQEGDSAAPLIVRDFVAWCSGRQNLYPGARDRLVDYLNACGWIDSCQAGDDERWADLTA